MAYGWQLVYEETSCSIGFYMNLYTEAESLNNSSPWRNRLARLTVNQEVGSSSLPGDDFLTFFFLLPFFIVTTAFYI